MHLFLQFFDRKTFLNFASSSDVENWKMTFLKCINHQYYISNCQTSLILEDIFLRSSKVYFSDSVKNISLILLKISLWFSKKYYSDSVQGIFLCFRFLQYKFLWFCIFLILQYKFPWFCIFLWLKVGFANITYWQHRTLDLNWWRSEYQMRSGAQRRKLILALPESLGSDILAGTAILLIWDNTIFGAEPLR